VTKKEAKREWIERMRTCSRCRADGEGGGDYEGAEEEEQHHTAPGHAPSKHLDETG
jgi:hypothetical protein